jgi:Phage capsid protein
MSNQITEAFVQAFDANFRHVAQQKTSRFEGTVLLEPSIVGESKSINRLGKRAAQQRLTRHGDTPLNEQPHSTRYIDLTDWEDGDMIDDQDKIRMLVDPKSDYVQAMVQALNRSKDDRVIAAFGGTSRSKSSGNVALPSTQKVAVGGTGLTRAKLVAARTLFRRNEADDENGEELYIGIHATGLSDLLTDTTLTNSEYNTVLSLQQGNIKGGVLLGFRPVMSEQFIKTASTRMVYAWAKSGVVLGYGENIVTRVGEDPSKSYNVRPYARMSLGAVRIEEEKVVEIACNDP